MCWNDKSQARTTIGLVYTPATFFIFFFRTILILYPDRVNIPPNPYFEHNQLSWRQGLVVNGYFCSGTFDQNLISRVLFVALFNWALDPFYQVNFPIRVLLSTVSQIWSSSTSSTGWSPLPLHYVIREDIIDLVGERDYLPNRRSYPSA